MEERAKQRPSGSSPDGLF